MGARREEACADRAWEAMETGVHSEGGRRGGEEAPCPGGSHPGLCSHFSAQVALVGQEPVLFSGSVRDNIAYGLESCSDEKVMAAAQAARADEFITEMEHGLNTGAFSQKRSWSLFLGQGCVPLSPCLRSPCPFWLPLPRLPQHLELSAGSPSRLHPSTLLTQGLQTSYPVLVETPVVSLLVGGCRRGHLSLRKVASRFPQMWGRKGTSWLWDRNNVWPLLGPLCGTRGSSSWMKPPVRWMSSVSRP